MSNANNEKTVDLGQKDIFESVKNIANSNESFKGPAPSKKLSTFMDHCDRALKISERVARSEDRNFGGKPF